MSLLLDTQQELVNTIEAQVENTAVYVEEGSKQVGEAIEYRKKSRKVGWRGDAGSSRPMLTSCATSFRFCRDGGGFAVALWF
jgi:hypothetical protein